MLLRRALPVLLALASVTFTVPVLAMDIDACRATLRADAPKQGVSVADFDRYTRDAKLLVSTVSAARSQPESRETWWDYLAKAVDDERVADGRAQMAVSAKWLPALSERYGVDSEVLVAIFGIETDYGRQTGRTPVLDAWLTRACTETKPIWRSNVYAAIKLLRDGVVSKDGFVGSWSGAFGMTQFIPTTFYELAVDGDGDGRIDLYGSLADVYASTANHLRKRQARWQRGVPAVIEVKASKPTAAQTNDRRRSLSQWQAAGVTRVDGKPLITDGLSGALSARLFAPTGGKGPLFLTTENFDALQSYNQSRRYALAVALLVERLRGASPLATPWPTDDPGLSRADIRELQSRLRVRGYDVGTPDGIPGVRTRDAVRAEQQAQGWQQDGRAGRKMLQRLRADDVAPSPPPLQ